MSGFIRETVSLGRSTGRIDSKNTNAWPDENSLCPICNCQPWYVAEHRIPCDQDGTSFECCRGDPQVILVDPQPLTFHCLPQVSLSVRREWIQSRRWSFAGFNCHIKFVDRSGCHSRTFSDGGHNGCRGASIGNNWRDQDRSTIWK